MKVLKRGGVSLSSLYLIWHKPINKGAISAPLFITIPTKILPEKSEAISKVSPEFSNKLIGPVAYRFESACEKP